MGECVGDIRETAQILAIDMTALFCDEIKSEQEEYDEEEELGIIEHPGSTSPENFDYFPTAVLPIYQQDVKSEAACYDEAFFEGLDSSSSLVTEISARQNMSR